MKQDRLKYNFAIDNGFKIYYIWETDIINDNYSVLNEIKNDNSKCKSDCHV